MAEFLLALLDERGDSLLVESTDLDIAAAIDADLLELLGPAEGVACAVPLAKSLPEHVINMTCGPTVRVSGLWHNSLIEGPGRRSVLKVQGCPLRCVGCYTPDSWDPDGGEVRSIEALAEALLDPDVQRDGVTILGGEPFAQPEALAALLTELRARQPDLHLLSYSGFTYESLSRRQDGWTSLALGLLDVLIDGPYVLARSGEAGPWTGSGNQRVIDMPATRAAGEVVLWQDA